MVRKKPVPRVTATGRLYKYNPRVHGVTQSLLGAFLTCRQKAHHILAGWESTGPRGYISFGNSMHAALEAGYSALHKGDSWAWAANSALQKESAALVAGTSGKQETEELELFILKAEALVTEYWRYWGAQDKESAQSWPLVEEVFNVPFTLKDGNNVPLRGKWDAVTILKDGGLWLVEHKTRSQIQEEDLSSLLAFDFQTLFYLTTLELWLTRVEVQEAYTWATYPVKGAIYNVIRTPQLRKSEKKGETDQEFITRLQEDVSDRPEHYFKRFELTFPPEVRSHFAMELRDKLDEFLRWYDGDGVPTYRNEFACVGRGACEFLKACGAGAPQAGRKSFAGYRQSRVLFAELAPADRMQVEAGGRGKSRK